MAAGTTGDRAGADPAGDGTPGPPRLGIHHAGIRPAHPAEPVSQPVNQPPAQPVSQPRPGGLAVEIASLEGTVTVVVYGELDVATVPVLRARLEYLPEPGPERLVFELAGLLFADCAGARVLAGVDPASPRARRPRASQPVLRHVRPAVRRVLDLTGLSDRCRFEPD